ncbi:MAG: hypothetical protein ACYDGO_02185 [Smithellaceae bacterium]
MYNNEITKKMIDGHKRAFETYFNSIVMLQEHTSKALDNLMKQSFWIPVEAKSIFSEWTGMYKKGTIDFKEAADENYSKLEKVLTSGVEVFKTKTNN